MDNVTHDDSRAASHIAARLGMAPARPFVGLVLERDGKAIGAVIVNGFAHGNCYITTALWGPVAMGQARHVFRYIFETLDCRRVTACTSINNARMQRMLAVLGFRYEGRHRAFYDGDDALVYGLLREEQRII